MKKTLLSIIIIVSIFGCVRLPSNDLKTEINSSNREGMIVGTISLEDRKLIATGHYFFYANDSIRNKIAEREYDATLKSNSTKWNHGIIISNSNGDFKEGEKQIYLFTIVRPEGKFNFYEIEIFLNSGYMQSSWKLPIDLPFEIQAGKTKYIGELNLKVKKGAFQVLNEIDRDRMLFLEKFPAIIF